MSTYYYLRCSNCEELGGWFSRQAWGWGNFDIFETFKFLVAHADCDSLQILSEYDIDEYKADEKRWSQRLLGDAYLREHVWPHADEWKSVAEDWETAKTEWITKFLRTVVER
jgi:hypothetical protein